MNWEALGAIGEIVGAVGIIITLVYLAVQIRSSARAAEAQVHASLSAEMEHPAVATRVSTAAQRILQVSYEEHLVITAVGDVVRHGENGRLHKLALNTHNVMIN